MKGTAPRGGTAREDDEAAQRLQESEKDRAENLMIVDMIRNDIGRVADIGTIAVPRLCGVERFPTVLQMTSTVTARVRSSFTDLMSALFPCASITGAPKVSTMGIIAELETTPRGLYCGSIGYLAPDGEGISAQFNVAIRTVTVDHETGTAEYGVGGGIVWDSDPVEEYRECEIKTRVLREGTPVFELLEAVLWSPADGYYLLDRHMGRLAESARYFGVSLDPAAVAAALDELAPRLPREEHKVRIAVSRAGGISVTAQPLAAIAKPAVQRVCLARHPVSSTDTHRYHKTSERGALDRELAEHARLRRRDSLEREGRDHRVVHGECRRGGRGSHAHAARCLRSPGGHVSCPGPGRWNGDGRHPDARRYPRRPRPVAGELGAKMDARRAGRRMSYSR